MEGPTGVMKQLEVLWHILELADREIFLHLSHIGAESLHFAFRMLLVLFRRELSFNESLLMWEVCIFSLIPELYRISGMIREWAYRHGTITFYVSMNEVLCRLILIYLLLRIIDWMPWLHMLA